MKMWTDVPTTDGGLCFVAPRIWLGWVLHLDPDFSDKPFLAIPIAIKS